MKYFLGNEAEKDLHNILYYFSKKDKSLVIKFDKDFAETCEMLLLMPEMACIISDEIAGKSKFLVDIRRWRMKKFKQYDIFYKKKEKGILIVRIINSKRDIPNMFSDWAVE